MPPSRGSLSAAAAAAASLSLLLLALALSASASQRSERLSAHPLRLFSSGRADGDGRASVGDDRGGRPSPSLSSEQACVPARYDTSARRAEGKLNVHLVPHTHDDAGWLKTVDQYHYALNQTIQVAGVAVLIDSVVAALSENEDRTFAYGEIAFFSRWWREASGEQRERVRSFVLGGEGGGGEDEGSGIGPGRRRARDTKRRQLSFVNGGWVQHDEACSFYEEMIEQTARGHSWLADAFADLSVLPTVGWQIDPFGHSATHADALVAGLGMDAVFFGRADHQDLKLRSEGGDLEVVWDGSDDGDGDVDVDGGEGSPPRPRGVLAGTFASGNYGPPEGFNWDWAQADDPIVDSTCASGGAGGAAENNVRAKVDAFVAAARALSSTVVGGGGNGTTGDVMMTMGSDFQYANAAVWFRNLDKLIHHVNLDGRVNVFYSSPADYVAAKAKAPSPSSPSALAFKLKTDDFFPYADCDSCYWTGYFSSRPSLKLDVRRSGAELSAAKQLAALDALSSSSSSASAAAAPLPSADDWLEALDDLEEAVALGQHHDAVSGTSRQHVAGDYALRLARGRAKLEGMVAGAVARRAGVGAGEGAPPAPRFCRAANASGCDVSVAASRSRRPFRVFAYNPLATERAVRMRVPISLSRSKTSEEGQSAWKVVSASDGTVLTSQVVPLSRGALRARDSAVAAGAVPPESAGDAHLAFVTPPIPPLGAAAFVVSPAEPGSDGASFSSVVLVEEERGENRRRRRRHRDRPLPPPAPRHPEFLLAPTADPGPPGREARDNDTAALVVDGASLEPTAVATRGSALPLRLSAAWYNASDGSPPRGAKEGTPGASPSGAYIFRPTPPDAAGEDDGRAPSPTAQPPRPYRRVFRDAVVGPVVAEVRQDFFDDPEGGGGENPSPSGGSASVDVSVWRGSPDAHVSWTVGPLPPSPARSGGAEVVLSYAAPLETRGRLLTDSNGRRLLPRKRDERPTWALRATEPVAGNFYPVVSVAAVEEEEAAEGDGPAPSLSSLSVVVDRAQGAASLVDGEVQLLAHRRLFFDDFRGVAEPLNETACGTTPSSCAGLVVAGEHVVVAARSGGEASVARRRAAAEASRPALVLFSDAGGGRAPTTAAPPPLPSIPALPPSLHLLTLAPAPRPAPEGSLLLRLSHSFGASERSRREKEDKETGKLDDDDGDFAAPATVDLNALIPGVRWKAVLETTVSGVKPLSDVKRVSWSISGPLGGGEKNKKEEEKKVKKTKKLSRSSPLECSEDCADDELSVTLGPLQVRTFLVLPESGGGGGAEVA